MGAKIGSFLATMMLSVPLAAVGLMAIFGVPQFVPAVGSNEGQDFWSDSQNLFAGWSQGQKDPPNGPQNGQDPFGQQQQQMGDAPRFGSSTGHSFQAEAGSSPQSAQNENWNYERFNGAGGNDLAQSSSTPQQRPANPRTGFSSSSDWPSDSSPRQSSMTETRSPQNSAGNSQWSDSWGNPDSGTRVTPAAFEQRAPVNALQSSAASLSWRQAALRFSEWGVDNYHLERGATEGTFLFVCMYSPGDAPHVTHRFESEADDPLLAVNQVIGQIDRWMQQRFADSNFPTRGQSLSLSSDPFLQ